MCHSFGFQSAVTDDWISKPSKVFIYERLKPSGPLGDPRKQAVNQESPDKRQWYHTHNVCLWEGLKNEPMEQMVVLYKCRKHPVTQFTHIKNTLTLSWKSCFHPLLQCYKISNITWILQSFSSDHFLIDLMIIFKGWEPRLNVTTLNGSALSTHPNHHTNDLQTLMKWPTRKPWTSQGMTAGQMLSVVWHSRRIKGPLDWTLPPHHTSTLTGCLKEHCHNISRTR